MGCLQGSVNAARIPEQMERALLCGGDGFRGLLESFELRAMQEFGNVQQNDETAFELPDSNYVPGLAVGQNAAGSFDIRRRNLDDFGGGIDDEAEHFIFEHDAENAVFLLPVNFPHAKPFPRSPHATNLP